MHMEKRMETTFLGYLILLLLLGTTSMISNMDVVNLVYLVVVLSCVLKFILIVNKNKK